MKDIQKEGGSKEKENELNESLVTDWWVSQNITYHLIGVVIQSLRFREEHRDAIMHGLNQSFRQVLLDC